MEVFWHDLIINVVFQLIFCFLQCCKLVDAWTITAQQDGRLRESLIRIAERERELTFIAIHLTPAPSECSGAAAKGPL